MKIAQVAPLCESVPPKLYGGTERVVSSLTEALVREGHDVTLFASGIRHLRAPSTAFGRGAAPDPTIDDPWRRIYGSRNGGAGSATNSTLHFHIDYCTFSCPAATVAVVTTLHGRLDLPELFPVFGTSATEPVFDLGRQRIPLQ